MSQIIANWTKLVMGVCAVILLGGYVAGRITTDDMIKLMTALSGLHLFTSGALSMLGGPVQNSAITKTDVMRAEIGANDKS
jgi:hypothetical protein